MEIKNEEILTLFLNVSSKYHAGIIDGRQIGNNKKLMFETIE